MKTVMSNQKGESDHHEDVRNDVIVRHEIASARRHR